MNAEIFQLTYGAMVAKLVKENGGDMGEVNKQLDKMGYNIGIRLIEEFLAHHNIPDVHLKKRDVREVADWISKSGMKQFLNVEATVDHWKDKKEFSVLLSDNPLLDFVELPKACQGLWYSNIICGVIRGALEMIQIDADVQCMKCPLRGDSTTEIRVHVKGYLEDQVPSL